MSGLSDRIAAEHDVTVRVQETRSGWRQPVRVSTVYDCKCGRVGVILDHITQHVADVTERAVRDTIAQQLDNLEHDREGINHSARHGFGTEWAEGHDHAIRVATALTREGTTP